jgi:hypothetical protein
MSSSGKARTQNRICYGTGIGVLIVALAFDWWCVTRCDVPLPRSLGHNLDAQFEWDSDKGFRTFRVVDYNSNPVGNRVWQALVGAQVKPRIDAYLRPSKLSHGLCGQDHPRSVPRFMGERWFRYQRPNNI